VRAGQCLTRVTNVSSLRRSLLRAIGADEWLVPSVLESVLAQLLPLRLAALLARHIRRVQKEDASRAQLQTILRAQSSAHARVLDTGHCYLHVDAVRIYNTHT
jgi:regulator of sirC expression with transglutaminase-like and TPR domain